MSAARLETFLQTHRRARPPSGDGVRFVELPQATLRVRVAGTGPVALVIVPDPPNVIEHYDRLIALLAPHLRVVCCEAPGFGFSRPAPGFDFSPASQAASMAALLARLALGPYLLAFPCFAGLVAVQLAAEHPELVNGLVIVQTPAWSEALGWKLVERDDDAAEQQQRQEQAVGAGERGLRSQGPGHGQPDSRERQRPEEQPDHDERCAGASRRSPSEERQRHREEHGELNDLDDQDGEHLRADQAGSWKRRAAEELQHPVVAFIGRCDSEVDERRRDDGQRQDAGQQEVDRPTGRYRHD